MAGDCDFLLRVVAADLDAYKRFQIEHLARNQGFRNIKTDIPMQKIKDSWRFRSKTVGDNVSDAVALAWVHHWRRTQLLWLARSEDAIDGCWRSRPATFMARPMSCTIMREA
jgi:hypothetical protein